MTSLTEVQAEVVANPRHEILLNKGQKVTPELAASVVRDFILPMFENDGKKILRKKSLAKGVCQ